MASTRTANQWVNNAPPTAQSKGQDGFSDAIELPAKSNLRSAPTRVKLTKRIVDAAPIPAAEPLFLRDSHLLGFALRITKNGVKSYVFERRIEGRTRRTTIARYGDLTVEQARKNALTLAGQVASGVNPIAEAQRVRLRAVTLDQAFRDFLSARKHLRPHTVYDYERLLKVALKDWASQPLRAISRNMVQERHRELGESRSPSYANLSMRFLRAVFNFAIAHYEDDRGEPVFTDNPVTRLNQTRAWYRFERRQTVIKAHQLPAWFAALDALRQSAEDPNAVGADYLDLLIHTGLRKTEALTLRWSDVDLADATLLIRDTKNREPLQLPLSAPVRAMLERRKATAASIFVFPGEGASGHMIEPRRTVQSVVRSSGVSFCLHDLRRTFITIAESLDVSPYAIKRLVNHKMRNDVTSGYIVSDIERLRLPAERIAEFLQSHRTGKAPLTRATRNDPQGTVTRLPVRR